MGSRRSPERRGCERSGRVERRGDRHRVGAACRHRDPPVADADLDRAGVVGGGAVAQLPGLVGAPGPQGAVGLDRHRVVGAGGH